MAFDVARPRPSEWRAPSPVRPTQVRADTAGMVPGMTLELFAGLRVRDLAAARPWYEQLLGEPAFFPNDAEVVWSLADARHLYIEQDPARAGNGLATVFVGDLDAQLATIAARGLEPSGQETYANGVRKAIFRDADANEVGFAGGPRGD
jgi:catechol 2,3-dioxygenase-like lactoylglutathione lyase family enzyme